MRVVGGRIALIYFILLFTGLAFFSFGYKFHVIGFMVAGIIWLIATAFALKSAVAYEIRKYSLFLLFFGGICGYAAAILVGESIVPVVGFVGGSVIGGIGAIVVYQVIAELTIGFIPHLILERVFEKISVYILLGVFVLGSIWGSLNLYTRVPKYFGTTGGGILLGGIIGGLAGMILGAQIIIRRDYSALQTAPIDPAFSQSLSFPQNSPSVISEDKGSHTGLVIGIMAALVLLVAAGFFLLNR